MSTELVTAFQVCAEVDVAVANSVVISTSDSTQVRAGCQLRRVDEEIIEATTTLWRNEIQLSLMLCTDAAVRMVPVISGNVAAVAEYGWSDQSIGRTAELRVQGEDLNTAFCACIAQLPG